MDFENMLVQLKVYEAGEQRITSDNNLSPQGKERALHNLRADKTEFRGRAHGILSSEWQAVRKEHARLEEQRKAEELAESERWNYPKLSHERQALEGKLRLVKSLPELEELYNAHDSSGIPERKRALYEAIPERALGYGSASLAKKAEQALEQLTTTDGMLSVRERGSQLVQKALALKQATVRAADFYHEPDYMALPSDFRSLMDGLSIKQRITPDGMLQAALEVSEPAQE